MENGARLPFVVFQFSFPSISRHSNLPSFSLLISLVGEYAFHSSPCLPCSLEIGIFPLLDGLPVKSREFSLHYYLARGIETDSCLFPRALIRKWVINVCKILLINNMQLISPKMQADNGGLTIMAYNGNALKRKTNI